MIAVPSMLIVAPKQKDATEFFAPIPSVTQRSVTGMMVSNEAVEKAKLCAGRIFFRNVIGLRPENILRITISVTNRCNRSAQTSVSI